MLDSKGVPTGSRARYVIIATIGALALSRFAFLDYASLRYDEIFNLIRSLEFGEHGGSFLSSVLGANSNALYQYLSLLVFGAGEFATRFPVVVQSLIIVLATYLIARHVFGRRTAVTAVFIALLLPFNFAFSRYAQYDIGQTCYFTLGAYFFICNDARSLRRNALGDLFFALAFIGKFNSLIPQLIIYFGSVLFSIKDARAWRYTILNAVLFAVAVLLYKAMFLPDLITSMVAWLSTIVIKPDGGTRLSFGVAAPAVLWKVTVATTLPLFGVMIYSIIRSFRRPRAIKVLALLCALYIPVLMVQGRLADRYINLMMPFAVILMAAGVTDLFAARVALSRRIVLVIILLGFLIQSTISFREYARWERQHEPFRAIGAFMQSEVEPTAERIFMPKNFPINYIGIMQLQSAWETGVRDTHKGGVYHLAYSPYNLSEQAAVPTSRMLFKTWLEDNWSRIVSLGVSGLKRDLKEFMDVNAGSDDVHEMYGLDELVLSGTLRAGDIVFVRIRGDIMYPSLWPRPALPDLTGALDTGIDYEVVKTFHIANTEREYARIIRITP